MAPVIRISEDLFRRLQAHGKPLVDTPSSVIERILDGYEAHAAPSGQTTAGLAANVVPDGSGSSSPQLFLAPASGENLQVTIVRSVSIDAMKLQLSADEVRRIEAVVGEDKEFRCWAMTDARRSVFASMRTDDRVLFTETGSGQFSYLARVLGKAKSEELGKKLWSVIPRAPWNLIYFLRDVKRVCLPKTAVLRELGFDPKYWLPGVIRVDATDLARAVAKYGSVDRLADALASSTGGTRP